MHDTEAHDGVALACWMPSPSHQAPYPPDPRVGWVVVLTGDPQSRWNRDRLTAAGPTLGRLFVSRETVSLDELFDAGAGVATTDILSWVGHALVSGLIEEVDGEPGAPRAFRLRRSTLERGRVS